MYGTNIKIVKYFQLSISKVLGGTINYDLNVIFHWRMDKNLDRLEEKGNLHISICIVNGGTFPF